MSRTQQSDEHPTESKPLLVSQRSSTVSSESDTEGLNMNESIKDDVFDILRLGFPIFLSSVSWVGVSTVPFEIQFILCIAADY